MNSIVLGLCGIAALTHQLLETENFSGSALIAQEGKVLLSKGYGYANREHSIPNTPETVFRLGSITKQFTAVAIMLLQEEGKLRVSDPISRYLPNYPRGDEITIHHLLTHTAGIPSITDFPNLSSIQRHPSTPESVMAFFKDLPLEFEPGSEMKYSDSGYIILGAIVEKVSGQSYETFLQENIFNPLEMNHTYVDHNQSIIPRRASGYNYDVRGKLVNAEFIEMSFPHGAGALASTVEDLYKWDRALIEGKILSDASREALFTPHTPGYGYGFRIGSQNEIGHFGFIEGFHAASFRFVDGDLTIILLSNIENAPLRSILNSWRRWR